MTYFSTERENGYFCRAAWLVCPQTYRGFSVVSERTAARVFTRGAGELQRARTADPGTAPTAVADGMLMCFCWFRKCVAAFVNQREVLKANVE